MALYQSHIFDKWRYTFSMLFIVLEKFFGERHVYSLGPDWAFISSHHMVCVALMGILNEIWPIHCNFNLNWIQNESKYAYFVSAVVFPLVSFTGKLYIKESSQYSFPNYVLLNWIYFITYLLGFPFVVGTLLVVRDKIFIPYLQETEFNNKELQHSVMKSVHWEKEVAWRRWCSLPQMYP